MARRELGPATLAVVQAVDDALSRDDAALLVACSGGPDSLALAFAALRVGRRRRLAVSALIVDHGLQPGSAEVAAAARDELFGLGFGQVRVTRVQVDLGGQGPEAAARTARYGALAAEAETIGATVLLGHTLDDQAETVLLGLARGSGVRSLAGMAPRSGRLLRPLLDLRRTVTEKCCTELGLHPWSDPHNADPTYARVRARRDALPALEAALGPGIAEALARTAVLARDDADLLDTLAAEADPGTDVLHCAELAALPPALRNRVIRRWLLRHGAADVSATHVAAVEALVSRWRGQGEIHLPHVRVSREDGGLHCRPEHGSL